MKEHLVRIEPALKMGGFIHAFMSGGGLRVLRLAEFGPRGDLMGYGESPTVDDAFRILADDYEAGGRKYGDVYGKVEPAPAGELDAWVRKGNTFDAWYKDGEYVVELRSLQEAHTPEETVRRCTAGETIAWTDDRRVTYQCSPSRFPNGERCCSTKIVKVPKGMTHNRAWMWYATQTGRGPTLSDAIDQAFKAPKVEVNDR